MTDKDNLRYSAAGLRITEPGPATPCQTFPETMGLLRLRNRRLHHKMQPLARGRPTSRGQVNIKGSKSGRTPRVWVQTPTDLGRVNNTQRLKPVDGVQIPQVSPQVPPKRNPTPSMRQKGREPALLPVSMPRALPPRVKGHQAQGHYLRRNMTANLHQTQKDSPRTSNPP